jgi:hypothetical protein
MTSTNLATGYTLCLVRGTTWRIYKSQIQNSNQNFDPRNLIDEYYVHEDASSMKGKQKNVGSFPFHHCLMRASLSSAQKLIDASCLHPFYTLNSFNAFNIFNTIFNSTRIDSTCALARIHATKQTPFTELTAYQKRHLIAQSAMTGVLVSRLFGISSAKSRTIRWSKKHADVTAKYIHSAFASECLIGNRYHYNLPAVLRKVNYTVGQPCEEKKYTNMKAEDATYEKIQENRARLIELYNSNIERLENAVKQFRRGLLSIETIREDSENKKMFEMFWILQSQCMKYRGVIQSGLSARQLFCESNNIEFEYKSINIMLCNLVFSCQAICPRLFAYEIAHLFDNCNGSYATYVKTTKAKQLELGSQGLISAFLTFSAVEPKMISMRLAPHMEKNNLYLYPSEFSNYAHHIPTRDAIFGPLISKHRHHIPRVANIGRTFFMTKNNKDCFYLPVQEVLTELQTGKKAAKESWKKNKKNFKENRIVTTKEISKRIM